MLGWLTKALGLGAPAKAAPPSLQGRFDTALTTDENRLLWSNVDLLSAKAANDPQTRSTLRMRSRYECANNSYARGITINLANDIVGTGPTLRVLGEPEWSRPIEAAWNSWAVAVDLAEKLRTMALAKVVDGEAFAVLITNPRVEHPVQLYPKIIEADQVMTPALLTFSAGQWIDGCVLDDATGDVIGYHVLRQHPGDLFAFNLREYDTLPKRFILHWFRRDRPGQVRGIPELTPALELFSMLRRFTKATIGAAEIAAQFAAMLESDDSMAGAGNTDEAGNATPFSTLKIVRDMMTVSPAGWHMKQFDPKQPVTTYDMFVDKIIAEACRCIDVPVNMALGTSQKFNFSSAKLDHFKYHRKVKIERSHGDAVAMNRLFSAFIDEAVMIPGLLPGGATTETIQHVWHWPPFGAMDPLVDAQADTERLNNGTTTLATIYAEQGKDWEDELEQRGKELEMMRELGITPSDPAAVPAGEPATGDATDPASTDAVAAATTGDVQATALNGAQIVSLLAVTDKLALKTYPADAAEKILQVAFPVMDRALIHGFIDALNKHEPPAIEEPDPAEQERPPPGKGKGKADVKEMAQSAAD